MFVRGQLAGNAAKVLRFGRFYDSMKRSPKGGRLLCKRKVRAA